MVELRPEVRMLWAFEELWFVLGVRQGEFAAEQRPALPHR